MIRGRGLSDGNLIAIDFSVANLSTGQTNLALGLMGATAVTSWIAPGPGYFIALSIDMSAAASAGTSAFTPSRNGSVMTGQVASDLVVNFAGSGQDASSASTTKQTAPNATGTATHFVKGDTLGVMVTTNGSWAPTNSTIAATLLVGLDVVVKND